MISKKVSEGHPNVLDIIQDGTIDVVINSPTGGRVFFLAPGASVDRVARYLKRRPIYISEVSKVGGVTSVDEINDLSDS